MNDIKFRAWDKKNKSMLHSELYMGPKKLGWYMEFSYWDLEEEKLKKDDESDLEAGYAVEAKYVLAQPENYIVMQYIGIKDKTGREVFELDVYEYSGKRYLVPLLTDIFEMPRFIRDVNALQHVTTNGIINDLKIVGNIYENPKLKRSL